MVAKYTPQTLVELHIQFYCDDLDTSQEGECSSYNDGCYGNSYGKGSEEKLKVGLREFGAKVVYEGMDLTQTKHSKCLQ